MQSNPGRTIVLCAGLAGVWLAAFAQAQSYKISTVAGGGTCGTNLGDGGPATSGCLTDASDVAIDSAGNVYITDNNKVRKVATNGVITTVAGGGQGPGIGDGGPATKASLTPTAIVVDPAGNLIVADSGNKRIRKVDTGGTITTIAGNGVEGNTGDGGPATSAEVGQILGLALDTSGNLYFVGIEKLLRKIDTSGIITTLAGRGSSTADGVPAASASFGYPSGVAVDSGGNIYVADGRIRKIAPNGIITTVAGSGANYSGDGGPATKAGIDSPWHVAVDAACSLYITERNDPFGTRAGNFIRLVNSAGIISTIAGNGTISISGDGGPATSAGLYEPMGLSVDPRGDVYFADQQVNTGRVRLLTPVTPLPPVPSASAPAVKCGGIVSASAYGQFGSIAPGSWIEIYGSNLSSGTRLWIGSDFNGSSAPTSLDGTSVTVGGQPAYVEYISPWQVDVQVPSGLNPGPQPVVVTTAAGSSSAYLITVNATEPGLLAPSSFVVGGKQYVAALYADGSTFVLPTVGIAGVPSRPAHPGDTITLYGVGFGPVTPNIAAGQVVQQSNALALPLRLFFGNTEATISYAGLAPGEVGLYQINAIVPNVPAGDSVALSFTLGGAQDAQTLYIAIQ